MVAAMAEPLPSVLSLAQARDRGLTPTQWRSSNFDRVTRGVRRRGATATLAEQAAAFALVLPRPFAYSHMTAARLLELPLPGPVSSVGAHVEGSVLDVIRPSASPRLTRAGVRGHRGLDRRRTTTVDGMPVVCVADTWVDLGELRGQAALSVDDLVVLGDEIAARLRLATVALIRAELGGALGRRVRPRRAVDLRAALGLVRPGVRSPMESRSRLMFVHSLFPEPEVNGVLRDETGQWLMECDLVWRGQRVVAEYQGQPHANLRARSQDAAKRRLAEDYGWRVHEIFAADVYTRPRRIDLLRRRAADLRLPPDTLRIQ